MPPLAHVQIQPAAIRESHEMPIRIGHQVRLLLSSLLVVWSIQVWAPRAACAQTVVQHDWEDGTLQGWTPFGGGVVLTNTTDAAHAGTRSLLTTGRTATFNGPSRELGTLLTAGTAYQFTAYVRLAPGESATQVKMTMRRTPTGGSGLFEQVTSNTAVTDSGWAIVQGSYGFAGSASSLLLYIESTSATASYSVDDFSVRVISAAGCSEPQDTSGIHTNFETGTPEGWRPRIGRELVTVTDSDAHAGNYSLLTTGRQASFDGAAINAANKLCNGSRYNISVWLKLAPGEANTQSRVVPDRRFRRHPRTAAGRGA
jgi:endo-1,4-beta-xylanase